MQQTKAEIIQECLDVLPTRMARLDYDDATSDYNMGYDFAVTDCRSRLARMLQRTKMENRK